MKNKRPTDLLTRDCGTVFQLFPLTRRASQWIDENVQAEPWQWMGGSLVVHLAIR